MSIFFFSGDRTPAEGGGLFGVSLGGDLGIEGIAFEIAVGIAERSGPAAAPMIETPPGFAAPPPPDDAFAGVFTPITVRRGDDGRTDPTPPVQPQPDGMGFVDISELPIGLLGFDDFSFFGAKPGEGPGGFLSEIGSDFFDWSWFGARGDNPFGGGPVGPFRPLPPEPPEFLPDVSGFTGAGQTIVVIDDGYSELYDSSNVVDEFDFFDNDPDAEISRIDSHGSQVAQIAIQLAADVQIVHLKAFPNVGEFAPNDAIEASLQWVLDNADDYDIAAVNLSLGGGNITEEVETQLSDEFAAIAELGIFTVVAAGNSGDFFADGVNVIAADPNAIAVSATDSQDRFTGFTQRSETLTDIAAPGQSLPVITLAGQILEVSGTSFAAPYVSGVAALVQEAALQVNGEKVDEDEFLEILRDSGRDVLGAPNDVDGYRVADAQAAVDFFLANADRYDDPGGLPDIEPV